MDAEAKKTTFLSLCVMSFFLFYGGEAVAQATGEVRGQITDAETGAPLPGVNVIIAETQRGTATNSEGNYVIINVPVGTHDVRATLVGYAAMTKTDVMVSSNQTATVNFALEEAVVEGQEVTVRAERDVLHKEVSNSQIVSTEEEVVEAAGVRNLSDFLSKQPGVSGADNLQIRGGDAHETGAIVNGLTLINERAGQAQTNIPLSAIDQVSVLTGGYNAEFGEFRSGLVDITTKVGGRDAYSGRVDLSVNRPHQKRFGPSIYDPSNTWLRPYMDPEVAFVGTRAAFEDDYTRQQYSSFSGWNAKAETYNKDKPADQQMSPLDLYLWNAWMHMVEPPFDKLEEMGYEVSSDLQQKFREHAREPEGQHSDYNIDAGFGGPIPLVGKSLGDATFYVSHRSSEEFYTQPVIINSQTERSTLLTLRANPAPNWKITMDGYHGNRYGASNDRIGEGGFQPVHNMNEFAGRGDTYHWYETYYHTRRRYTSMAGLTLNYVAGSNTFWELKLSAVNEKDRTPPNSEAFPRDPSVVAEIGAVEVSEMPYNYSTGNSKVGDTQYGQYESPFGISRRFANKAGNKMQRSDTWQYRAGLDFTSQLNLNHQLKTGATVKYTAFDHEMWWYRPFKNETSRNFTWADRTPVNVGAYVQDQITFEGMVANIGLRADYYRPGGVWPSDSLRYSSEVYGTIAPLGDNARENTQVAKVWERWQKIDEEHPGFLQPVESSFAVSPRLGVSFPVTTRSKFYFNYGHFRSLPPARQLFQIGYRPYRIGFLAMGNPRMRPPQTISYETGVEYNLADRYLVRLAGYYKDITGEPGEIEYISNDGRISYDSYSNNHYEDVQGLEFTIRRGGGSWFSGWANFDFLFVKEGFTGVEEFYEDPSQTELRGRYQGQESRLLPRPSFTANIRFNMPDEVTESDLANAIVGGWRLSVLPQWQEGGSFTWNPLGKLHLQDNLEWQDYSRLDARLTRSFEVADGTRLEVYADVRNVLNQKMSNLSSGNAFMGGSDRREYLASLRLPMYDSEEFETLREQNPGKYIAGNDEVGDLRSAEKPYINDPNLADLWGFTEPRDIWFGIRASF